MVGGLNVNSELDGNKTEEDVEIPGWSAEVDDRRNETAPIEPAVETFDRALDPGFIARLRAEYDSDKGVWWRDVLSDEEIVIAHAERRLILIGLGRVCFMCRSLMENCQYPHMRNSCSIRV